VVNTDTTDQRTINFPEVNLRSTENLINGIQ